MPQNSVAWASSLISHGICKRSLNSQATLRQYQLTRFVKQTHRSERAREVEAGLLRGGLRGRHLGLHPDLLLLRHRLLPTQDLTRQRPAHKAP